MGLTGAIFNHLTFGGVCSADYGIYITGEGVFNAPERVVEFVDVPGRNGAIALDQGSYSNISVTYPAGAFGLSQKEFREALAEFRNAVLSQKGYQRLEDTYHPDEFRMGLYASGLEVEPAGQNIAGQFELTFNCKPQRWLVAGDLPIPVDSGDVLQNPTLFDSEPLLEIEGYGNISFNGFNVALENAELGNIEIVPQDAVEEYMTIVKHYSIDTSLFNAGDDITVSPVAFTFYVTSDTAMYTGVTYTIDGGSTITPSVKVPSWSANNRGNSLVTTLTFPEITQAAIASGGATVTKVAQVVVSGAKYGGGTDTATLVASVSFYPDKITVAMSTSTTGTARKRHVVYTLKPVMVDSSVNLLGHPTYIDCEMGEAYRVVNGEYQSLNAYVALGSDLPRFAPGSNKIVFDNTITDLKIAPRWWRL